MTNRITPDEYRDFVGKLFFRNGDLSKDFAHAALGILEEVHEARNAGTYTNLLEEAGDLLFFGTAADIVLREHMQALGGPPVEPEILECLEWDDDDVVRANLLGMYKECGPMLGLGPDTAGDPTLLFSDAKKWVGYGAAPDEERTGELIAAATLITWGLIGSTLHEAGDALGELFQNAARANIAKLKHRYPGGFNLKDAAERDREGEAQAVANA